MKDLECPYCEAGLDVCHDDGFGYEEDKAHEMECDECGKSFVFHTSVHYYYEPSKADCLNGEPHNLTEWRKIHQWDDGLLMEMRSCRDCDHHERRTTLKPTTPQ